jgi:hypothetical protein
LQVNGILAQDIDVTQIESFDVTLDSLAYGDNRFQVVAVDDQGHRIATPEVVMTILQGETVIPEAVAPSSAVDRIIDRSVSYGKYVGGCLLLIIVIVVLVVVIRMIRKRGKGTPKAPKAPKAPKRIGVPYWLRRVPFLRRYIAYADRAEDARYTATRTKREASRYAPDVQGLDRKGKSRPAAFLEVLQSSGQAPGRIDLDAPELRLGRSSKQADIAFSGDSTVSRIHATVVQEGGVHRIFDEQSTSGTFVNEQRVPQHGIQLADSDEIRLGAVLLRYRQP